MSEFMTAAEMAELAEMDSAYEKRDIEVITEEINFYKRQAGSAILEIGKRLVEAKEQLSHGEWLPWLEEKVAFSERSAQQYMRLWKEYGKSATVADLGVRKALVLLALPESEREDFAAEKHDVDGQEKTALEMTRKELEKAVAERNAARAEADKVAADVQEAKDTALAAQENLAQVRRELEELKSRPVEVAVQTVDASAEQIAAARLEAEKAAAAQVEKAKKTLAEAQERLRKAEEQAAAAAKEKDAALDAAKSYKAEAEAARKKLAASGNEGLIKFKTLFDQTVANVNALAELLRQQPEEEREKLGRAMQALSQQIGGIAI